MKYLIMLLILITPCIASSELKEQISDIKDKLEEAKFWDESAQYFSDAAKMSEQNGDIQIAAMNRQAAEMDHDMSKIIREEAEKKLEEIESNIGSDDDEH